MQRDFVPRSTSNVDGGRFGVAEGAMIASTICNLIDAAAGAGATIIASRDYHPHDHCSFASQGGPFPAHCVQGTAGSKFLPEIAAALERAMRNAGPSRVCVVFKAMHEGVDSFGALPYAAAPHGRGRLAMTEYDELEQSRFERFGGCMGCAAAPWTGSLALKQSALIAAAADGHIHDGDYDADAPPDVLSVLRDGIDRKLQTMQDVLAKNCPTVFSNREDGGRVYVCGLALDFCVHDTCVNASTLGITKVSMIVDAARAAHIAGKRLCKRCLRCYNKCPCVYSLPRMRSHPCAVRTDRRCVFKCCSRSGWKSLGPY